MSCAGCAIGDKGSAPAGCRSNGHCATGGCNKLNTYDWLKHLPVPAEQKFHVHEISFKNGIRKGFFYNKNRLDIMTGDLVCVETESGYDVGRISLSGELVKLQMKKRKVDQNTQFAPILRKASDNELQKMMEGRAMEGATMLKARKIARELKLEMKIGEVEYQGDRRKATFYYIADDRVDFRELIKIYAREFHVKIEMRQIGARQEAGKIGGVGSCGRELCCATWLQDFKSVGTGAARYQNLSINQSKLSGQCGRLKCCLNYELDTYMDALQEFPKDADVLYTLTGDAHLVKTDIFKKLMVYEFSDGGRQYPLTLAKVHEIRDMNKRGEKIESLELMKFEKEMPEKLLETADVIGQVSLRTIEKAEKKRKEKQRNQEQRRNQETRDRNQDQRDRRQDSGNRNQDQRNRNDNRNQQNRNQDQRNRNQDTRNRNQDQNRNQQNRNDQNRNDNRNRNQQNRNQDSRNRNQDQRNRNQQNRNQDSRNRNQDQNRNRDNNENKDSNDQK